MNKTTKIAALPLAALLTFGAAGCGNDDNDKDTANNSGTSVSASTSTKATLNSAKKAISAAYKAYPNSKALNLATTTNSKEGWVVTLLTAPANFTNWPRRIMLSRISTSTMANLHFTR